MNENFEELNKDSPKKFVCNVCDVICSKFSKLQLHNSTTKHKERVQFEKIHRIFNENEIIECDTKNNGPKKFYCDICDVTCSKFSKLKSHCCTAKHKHNVAIKNKGTNEPCEGTMQPCLETKEPTNDEPKQADKGSEKDPEKVLEPLSCKICYKNFKSNSGLWYHSK